MAWGVTGYHGTDLEVVESRVAAFYSLADCARLLRRPKETVREWTTKRLAPARARRQRASPSYGFPDLISLRVVAALRDRGVPLQRIRKAEDGARVLAGPSRNQRRVFQRVVGAMDNPVAIEDSETGRSCGHEGIIATPAAGSHCRSLACCTSSASTVAAGL